MKVGSLVRQTVGVSTPDHRSIDQLIEAVPWGRLTFAYGFALDAPAMLHGQVNATDYDSAFEDWMFSAVIHQGTPYSGTAPTLWLLRRIVDERPDHPALRICLSAVAECATALSFVSNKEAGSGGGTPAAPALHRSMGGDPLWASVMPPGYVPPPKTYNWVSGGPYKDDYFKAAIADVETLKDCVADWQPVVARCLNDRVEIDSALQAGTAVVRLWPHGQVVGALAAVANDPTITEQHRAAAVFGLSRSGCNVTGLVASGDRAAQFAMALGESEKAGHLEVLIHELEDLPWLLATFPQGLPGAEPWMIAAVVAAVLKQTTAGNAGELLVNALVAVLSRPSGPLGATYEWGPVLVWAFPDRVQTGVVKDVPLPESLTPLQARLVAALIGNDKVWAPKSGNDSLALRRVGLPHDRATLAKLVEGTNPESKSRWLRRN